MVYIVPKTELTLQSQKRCVSVSGEIYTWELLTIRYWWGGVLFFSLDQKKWTGKYLKREKLETVVHVFEGLVYWEKLETVVHVFVGLVYCKISIILFETRI